MFFLSWIHFKKENKRLHENLGVDKGNKIDLAFSDGFFICPDDRTNQASKLPKIILNSTIIEFFAQKYHKIYHDVDNFYKIGDAGVFDKNNYMKLKIGAKTAYFFAAAQYIFSKKFELKEIGEAYRGAHQKEIEDKLSEYLKGFVETAKKRGVKIKLADLFRFAKSLVLEISPNAKIDEEFNEYMTFVRSKRFYPYGTLLGTAFEQEVQGIFEKLETKNENHLAKLVQAKVGETGTLIPLDEDPDYRDAATKAKGFSVPDYIYVTGKHIIPIDLKINLDFAKPEQVSAKNLRGLFEKTSKKIDMIFQGLTIEGKYIETHKEEVKKEKALTPMIALKDKGLSGKDLGTIAQLWSKQQPIDQDTLASKGISGDLGMIVDTFNNLLKK
jgi:hypothetical protein